MSKLLKDIKPLIKNEHKGKILYQEDPMKFLIEKDLLVQIGNGLFLFKGILVKLLNRIESLICEIVDNVNAEHIIVPYILSWENTIKSHYLNSFKNQALAIISYDGFDKGKIPSHIDFEGLASPTVCYHYFSSLRNRSVNKNYAITAIAMCTRREQGILNDLSRLTNFTMREVVFFGTQEYCFEKIREVLNATTKLLDSVLDLTYTVTTANDPFFGDNAEIKSKAQLISESKYEIQTLLPFKKSTISIGSFNNHGTVFYDRFNITPEKPEYTYSGCIGWGYERLLFTILAQKGIDFSSSFYKKLFSKD